jgi:hypothetical protein
VTLFFRFALRLRPVSVTVSFLLAFLCAGLWIRSYYVFDYLGCNRFHGFSAVGQVSITIELTSWPQSYAIEWKQTSADTFGPELSDALWLGWWGVRERIPESFSIPMKRAWTFYAHYFILILALSAIPVAVLVWRLRVRMTAAFEIRLNKRDNQTNGNQTNGTALTALESEKGSLLILRLRLSRPAGGTGRNQKRGHYRREPFR